MRVRSERFAVVPQSVVEIASGNAVKLYAVLYGLGSFDRPERSATRPDLADRLEVSVDTVDRLLRELVGIGAVEIVRAKKADGSWGPSTYVLEGGRTGAATLAAPVRRGSRTGADSSSGSSEVDPQSTTSSVDEDFATFWEVWPKERRNGKGAARDAFRKAVAGEGRMHAAPTAAAVILDGARRFAADPNLPTDEPSFIPLPATWLNQERWDDGPLPDRGRGRGATVHDIASHLRRVTG